MSEALIKKVIDAARLFCESTIGEMDELEGTQSASAPAEFMLLHEAIKDLDIDAAPAPQHAFELQIKIGANTWEYALQAVDEIRRDLDRNGEHTGCASGGYHGCYSITIQRRDIAPDDYRDELLRWSEADRARRQG